MRNKVRKSLAFLLALALVVSVMSGLGLSVSAEQESNTPGTEEVQQQDKTEAPSEVKAEEEAAKPEGKPVQEEKEDEQKKQEEKKTDDAAKDDANAQDGDQKDEPQAEPAAEEPAEPVEQASVPIVQAAAGEVSQYTITCGDQSLTVKLVDDNDNPVKGIAPKNLTIKKDTATSVDDYVAEVEDYTYSKAYYYYYTYYGSRQGDVTRIAYSTGREPGWYSVGNFSEKKIDNDIIYLVYAENSAINDTFTIHYVDENGKEIGNKTQTVTVNGDKTIVFNKWAEDIPGYTYWRACYDSENNAEVTKAVYAGLDWWNHKTYYFYNNSNKALTAESDADISQLTDIYLVYVKNGIKPTPGGTTGGSGTEVAEPTHSKKADRQSDGTYNISLDVSGSVGTDEKKAILDVVYVLDVSKSMDWAMDANNTTPNNAQERRLAYAKAAIETMTNSLSQNNKIKARFSLVTFATTASIKQSWTESAADLKNSMNNFTCGGTNYEAAFNKANELLGSTNPYGQASKVIVFVSDGNPTYYGNGLGSGSSDNDGRAMSKARGVVKTMLPNYLFTVGVGPEENYSQLSKITDAAHEGVNMGVTSVNFEGTSEESLKSAFKIMEGSITSIACEKVTISDKLSANVAMVMADGKPKKLVGKVTDKNGNSVGTPSSDGKIALPKTNLNDDVTLDAPTYDGATRTFEWKFPDGYKLEAGYTYTVTANVDVTETAFENYRKGINENSNRYPDTPDAGTGTHANDKGLFSNDNENAKLIYTVTGESTPKEVNYQKPVVQLTPSKLTIKKTVNGLNEDALNQLKGNLKFKVTYTYKNGKEEEKTVSFSDFTKGTDDTYTSSALDCWSMDATYTVVEEGFEVEGYDRTGGDTTVRGKIEGRNRDATATFTNTYTPSNRTITLKKVVGGNMGDTNKEFQFNVSKNATMSGNGKLKDNGETTITAKVGETVTITEDDYTSDGYTTTATATEGVNGEYKDHSYTFTVTKDMSASTIITFTNTKTIQPPNGIITTIAPYAIMVVLAAGAGVYFVYSRRRRNR